MYFKYDIDTRSLTQGSDNRPVMRLSLAFPDKYPLKVAFTRGQVPYSFTGTLRVSVKPLNSPGATALAAMVLSLTSASVVEGILALNTSEMSDFVKSFASRPVVLELLAVTNEGAEIASWAVESSVARRYTGVDDIATELPSLKATEQEAVLGENNVKWMTPLRVWQAIGAWAAANFTWLNLSGKPDTFPPSPHTHNLPDIQSALESAGIELESP